MTREDAKDMATDHDNWIVSETENLIDKIFDEFKDMTCGTCKYFVNELGNTHCNLKENELVYVGWETMPLPTKRNQLCHKWKKGYK